ncbi:MAG: HAMP domain-containing histidine kinase [Lachnospiraceae bacterium]|nr:HAMP domain-containing histidine kinase [Lachnospiraceae bacterium]
MKFKRKFTLYTFLAILLPCILTAAVYLVVDYLWELSYREQYGIDGTYDLHILIPIIAAGLATAFISTALVYHFWIKPVNKLNEAIKHVSQGDLDLPVEQMGRGEMGRMISNFEDMRKRLKESLDERLRDEKESRELISNISHDLKTPITAIKGYVEGIMDGVADSPEKRDKYLRTIYNKANDMTHLINELTVYSQIDTNRIPYNFHRLNVVDYFNDCADELGLELEEKGIGFEYVNDVASDVLIIADPEQLRRVVNNIIGNSVKYMGRENGKISIAVTDISDSVRVEIADNGRGIAKEDLPNIFDRFYRADASRNSSQGGSGIGLSIVKKIIEDHSGYIWATSEEDKGTTMHFVLRKYSKREEEEV